MAHPRVERLSDPRYRTKRWLALRAEQLSIEPLCRYCMQQGRITPAKVVDHVKPHRGDEQLFWYGELQSLCKPCHDGAKQEMERTGHLRGSAADGTPLDPAHHWNAASAVTEEHHNGALTHQSLHGQINHCIGRGVSKG